MDERSCGVPPPPPTPLLKFDYALGWGGSSAREWGHACRASQQRDRGSQRGVEGRDSGVMRARQGPERDRGLFVLPVTSKVKQVKDCVTNTSGLVKLSELRSSAQVGKAPRAGLVPDSIITQREEEPPEEPAGGGEEGGDSRARRRRTNRTAGEEREKEKAKGRRQRDFDPTAVEDDSGDERKPACERPPPPQAQAPAAEDVWTQNQQRLLELALQQYPRGTTERWDKIAKVVPGKTKEECMIRYKLLAELVQKRKQAKS
ncbi:hypothetical protein JZ751_000920 [Albula glossodonta]|uniref:Uncharacterized protein n=1 Tax=Albula glossodonta TaxID=121402 RepID=A0A8T2PY12_9TELE|nr:hypothetical protein JZ751_000920 [Albula glossodonta]